MSAFPLRPLPRSGRPRPQGAVDLAGGPLWFDTLAEHRRDGTRLIAAAEAPPAILEVLRARRAPLAGVALDRPRIMGVLNVTPDSFSDGGRHLDPETAAARGLSLVAAGADFLDVGGESTRPGAEPVPAADEIARVVPVLEALREAGLDAPISIDTRKAEVARAAFAAGAEILNDVSALTWDPDTLAFAAECAGPVCLMHARGDPRTMQEAPRYDDVLLDVYAFLEERVAAAEAAGIARDRIIVDPGIGFGKTVEHNLDLVRGLSIFHGLGCALLLGASRKRFIGTLAGVPDAAERGPGSIAVALEGLRQGAQVIRVHDVPETRQAIALWSALNGV